ncbi:hypothetical protein SNEBB_005147 [Seison nebaliae]|nr:hypothetical protein SNEBB_005147 [Seison nebaliae]
MAYFPCEDSGLDDTPSPLSNYGSTSPSNSSMNMKLSNNTSLYSNNFHQQDQHQHQSDINSSSFHFHSNFYSNNDIINEENQYQLPMGYYLSLSLLPYSWNDKEKVKN